MIAKLTKGVDAFRDTHMRLIDAQTARLAEVELEVMRINDAARARAIGPQSVKNS